MSDETIRALTWVGLAVGIAVVAMVLDGLLKSMINRRTSGSDPMRMVK